eukprot:TRINITY_DN10240_c0_g1_i1.p1 TRINITY_DN10240_c0_g1~~TRINITY_DN10240_c0_g1_i1.p1  ORF type:complete len:625 (+),score=116.58 TRINITY_DN10240_c0_g1_i1:31-1875(+)
MTSIQTVQEKLAELDESGFMSDGQEIDTTFERFDLLFPLLLEGDLERNFASEKLSAMIDTLNPREMYSLLMERFSQVSAPASFVCVLGLLGRAMASFTRQQHQYWSSCFPVVFRFLEKFILQDGLPQSMEIDKHDSDQEDSATEEAGTEESRSCGNANDARSVQAACLAFVAALCADSRERPWVQSALVLQFCFKLLAFTIDSYEWPKSSYDFRTQVISLDEQEQIFSNSISALLPIARLVVECNVPLPLLIQFNAAGAADEPETAGPARPSASLKTDSESEGDLTDADDEDSLPGESGAIDGRSNALRWDSAGFTLFLLLAASAATGEIGDATPEIISALKKWFPPILSPQYLLRTLLPHIGDTLERGSLTTNFVILRLMHHLFSKIGCYNVELLEEERKGDGVTREEWDRLADQASSAKEFATFSPAFQRYFEFCQRLAGQMVFCPSRLHRETCHAALMQLFSVFAEYTRHRMMVASVRLCPYGAVSSLVLLRVKEEVLSEYRLLEKARSHAGSAFLHPRTLRFLELLLEQKSLSTDIDVIMNALNFYLFLLLRDKPHCRIGVHQAENVTRMKSILSKLRKAAGAQKDSSSVQAMPMAMLVIDRIEETLQGS